MVLERRELHEVKYYDETLVRRREDKAQLRNRIQKDMMAIDVLFKFKNIVGCRESINWKGVPQSGIARKVTV